MMARIWMVMGSVVVGAVGMYVYQAATTEAPAMSMGQPAAVEAAPAGQSLVLTDDVAARAGLVVTPATASTDAVPIRVPGVVEPDAYRTVEVTPIVSGTVISMSAVLGDQVADGAPVGRLRSPELTDEVRRWLTARAALDAVSRRAERTTQLAKIGAASREEVEAADADLVRASTEADTARARLVRLGLTEADLTGIAAGQTPPEIIAVQAPAGGVVLRRSANPGQNVSQTDSLVTLADVHHVWVMADVFERDLDRMRVGQRVTVTSQAFGDRTWSGRVAYIDPELARDTRTARVRVEVDNPDAALRFGMYVLVGVQSQPAAPRVRIPRAAVQTLGAASVVYVESPGAPLTFIERPVLTGDTAGENIEIRAGLSEGERVVGAGSFFLRAERERLGWPLPEPLAPLEETRDAGRASGAAAPVPVVEQRVIEITATGLTPDRIVVPARQPVDLVFVRRTDETCGTEILIEDLGIRRALPLNERVVIRLPARAPGDLAFSCGMDMLRGVIVVRDGRP